jgi:RsiW-degrading membrane proteinase PrsW (M82 family)
MFITLILPSIPNQSQLPQYELFGAEVLFTAFALFGIIGGIAGLYHSIRSVFMNRPSRHIYLPPFWIFVILYAAVIAIAFVLYSQGQAISNPPLDTTLILLSGLTPALAILALGERRLRTREEKRWPTSWRRFIVALISGGTLAIVLAAVLELALISALARGTGVAANLCLSNPNDPSCTNPNTYGILLVTLAIVAPLVEEMVKPLAVIILIGRVRSAIEAFALGLACGIGFDLIETSGYIAFGYQNWMATALSRTGTGLLHGFGAAMVALGWYYLSHPGNQHTLKAVGCWLYAIAQHAIWNGSWGLALLPGQLGQFFANLQLTIGPVTLDYYELALIIEAILILAFFLYMTGRLRRQAPSTKVEKVALAR